MLITLRELRRLIAESYAGSYPDESYDHELEADPAYKKKSVLVPDDIKKSIKKWSRSMGLSGVSPRRRKKRHI